MTSYMFHQRCRPKGDLRVKEILQWLELMRIAFGVESLYDTNNRPVHLNEKYLFMIFEMKRDRRFPEIGVNKDFFSIQPKLRSNETIRFEIHTGCNPKTTFIDTYHVDIGSGDRLPAFDYFKESIRILRPFEAYLSESRNEINLGTYDRQQAMRPYFSKPAIIRGFHYLDEGMASSIGGIDYCLQAPAWKVEKFCEGILIQLVEGEFNSESAAHLESQQVAMEYFKL